MISGNSGWFTPDGDRLAEPRAVAVRPHQSHAPQPSGPVNSPSSRNVVAGRRIDGYELLCAVGHGGRASVWAAGRRGEYGLDKLVAIKTLLPEYAYDERFRETFVREARIASRIEHIHVARILDVGEDDHLLYLVTEWINGDSLSQLRRCLAEQGVPLPLGVTLRILSDLCAGLHAAHELSAWGRPTPVVHRRLSPHNILVNTRGVTKLIDFGIADAWDRAAAESPSGIRQSRLAYMAPEHVRGEKADRRSDVWSVGAILYKLLSGKAPFQGDQLAAFHSGAEPPPLPAEIHPAVAAVVTRALKREPHRRFATAAELQAALQVAMVDARVPTTAEDVADLVAIHLGDRIAARHDAVARAVVFASQAARRADRSRRIIGRRSKVQSTPKGDPSPMETTDQTTKVDQVPRDGMTGALAGLFGAIALLAVVASGLILRPAYVQKPNSAAAEPPSTAVPSLGASADTAETAEPSGAPVTGDHPSLNVSGADAATATLPAKSKRTKGKTAPESREVRKSEKHREAAQGSHSTR